MRNRIAFTALCLMTMLTAWSLPVTKEQAISKARQFIHQQQGSAYAHRSPAMIPMQIAHESSFYIFNIGTDDGFVIVSADDCTMPILGWCDNGSFNDNDMPDNMRAMLENYAEEIEYLRNSPVLESASPTYSNTPANTVKEAIAPMITTKWNQDAPFNQQCPYFLNDPSNSRCYTGCVATSMAQVLAFSGNRPAGTTADIPAYDCTTVWTADSIRIHVDRKPKTTFDWDNMLDVYDSNATNVQKQAVAKLMAYCGASVNANYSYNKTSAPQSLVVSAFRTYFNTDATRIMRQDYTYAEWSNIIYDELQAGRPVLYDGLSSGGGHSFIIDGFDGGELFHVNWGWGGHNDGYFALSILHPNDNSGIGASTSDDGYSYYQGAIIGIQPGVSQTNEPEQLTLRDIYVSGNRIYFAMYNHTGQTNTFDAGIGAIDNQGNISNVITARTNWTLNDSWGNASLWATINGNSLEPGVYHFVATSKLSSSNTWLTTMPYWKDYIEVTVSNSHYVTLRQAPEAPVLSLVGGLTYPSRTKYVGEATTIKAIVSNSGGEFCGPLYLFASQTNNKGEYYNRLGMTIASGSTAEASFSFTPSEEGIWNIWLCTDPEGNSVLGENTMVVDKYTYTKPGYLEITNLRIYSPYDDESWTVDSQGIRQVDVLSKSLSAIPTVRNTSDTDLTGSNKVQVILEKWQNGEWNRRMLYTYTITNFRANTGYNLMSGGGPISFEDVGYGLFRIAVYLDNFVQDVHYQLNLTGGYSVWDDNGNRSLVKTTNQNITVADDIAAIDLTGYDFNVLTPNNNPNTLYFLGQEQNVPATLNGRNVVKNGAAQEISLQDGFSFYSPVDFTAASITYRRTFTTGLTRGGTGWNTISLPFSPTNITAGGSQADWYRSGDDEGKDFYLMEFTGDDNTHAYFDYATDFVPCRPYIIGIPCEEFGASCLTNKEMVFSADNTVIQATTSGVRSGGVFKFYNTLANTAQQDTRFVINDAGSAFLPATNGLGLNSAGQLAPFRAYFIATSYSPQRIDIDFTNFMPTGISIISADDIQRPQGIYTINGVRMDESRQLIPGLYIINGKKTVLH